MANELRQSSKLKCPQCGSKRIDHKSKKQEAFCKKCGTVIEEDFAKF